MCNLLGKYITSGLAHAFIRKQNPLEARLLFTVKFMDELKEFKFLAEDALTFSSYLRRALHSSLLPHWPYYDYLWTQTYHFTSQWRPTVYEIFELQCNVL